MVGLTEGQKLELKKYSLLLAELRQKNLSNKGKAKLAQFGAIFQELDEKGYVDLIPVTCLSSPSPFSLFVSFQYLMFLLRPGLHIPFL